MIWQVTYYICSSALVLGGAILTLVFVQDEHELTGWRGKVQRHRVRIWGGLIWLVGAGMMLYGLWLQGALP